MNVFTTVGPGASLGCNPLRAHLGLGRAQRVAFVEARWPASGETQRIDSVPIDAAIRIRQGQPMAERIERTRTRLGGGR